MNAYINGIIRHLLTGLGSVLVAKGLADDATVQLIIGGVMALIGVVWSMAHKQSLASLQLVILMVIGLSVAGCSTYTTRQTDTSYEKGLPLRTITTQVRAGSVLDAKNALNNSRTSNTDKTQSSAVGSLSQESSGQTFLEMFKLGLDVGKKVALPAP